jgi:hypothetical protein
LEVGEMSTADRVNERVQAALESAKQRTAARTERAKKQIGERIKRRL